MKNKIGALKNRASTDEWKCDTLPDGIQNRIIGRSSYIFSSIGLLAKIFAIFLPCQWTNAEPLLASAPVVTYEAPAYQWAIQSYSPALRERASVAHRKVLETGTNRPVNIDAYIDRSSENVSIIVDLFQNGPGGTKLSYEFSPGSRADLPDLPRGVYWISLANAPNKVAVRPGDGLILNILESEIDRAPSGIAIRPLRIDRSSAPLTIVHVNDPREGAKRIKITYLSISGRYLQSKEMQVEDNRIQKYSDPQEIWSDPDSMIARVEYFLNDILVDSTIYLARPPGNYPAIHTRETAKCKGESRENEYYVSESLNTAFRFEEQIEGIVKQLEGMTSRGVDHIQLSVVWSQIEPAEGRRNWANLDKYISLLSQKGIPFVLWGAGGMPFGNGPFELWGDWMLDQSGRFDLWRGLPVVSPASQRYLNGAKGFVRDMIARYKSNNCLLGYSFSNQGVDSAVFFDSRDKQGDRITDFSYQARVNFREFLRRKYNSSQSLRGAWGDERLSLETINPPLPTPSGSADLRPAWKDWTEWKLELYEKSTIALFDKIVQDQDARAAVTHYLGMTGPVEHLILKRQGWNNWRIADGGGETSPMFQISLLANNWGVRRQTEPHNVPPGNLGEFQRTLKNGLVAGLPSVRLSIMWNTDANNFHALYPSDMRLTKMAEYLSAASTLMREYRNRKEIPPKFAVLSSWDDLLYREKVWRWNVLGSSRAMDALSCLGIDNYRWLSDLSLDGSWFGIKILLIDPNPRIWGEQTLQRVRRFVLEGGRIIVTGDSMHSVTTSGRPFSWINIIDEEQSDTTERASKIGTRIAPVHSNATQSEPIQSFNEALATKKGRQPSIDYNRNREALPSIWVAGRGKGLWLPRWKAGTKLSAEELEVVREFTGMASGSSLISEEIVYTKHFDNQALIFLSGQKSSFLPPRADLQNLAIQLRIPVSGTATQLTMQRIYPITSPIKVVYKLEGQQTELSVNLQERIAPFEIYRASFE